jgi:hypothetical protein
LVHNSWLLGVGGFWNMIIHTYTYIPYTYAPKKTKTKLLGMKNNYEQKHKRVGNMHVSTHQWLFSKSEYFVHCEIVVETEPYH